MLNGRQIVVRATFRCASAQETGLEYIIGNHQIQHSIASLTRCRQHVIEFFGLGHITREAIQDPALLGIRFCEPIFDDPNDQFIGHQFTTIHEGLRRLSQGGALGNCRAQDITRGNMGNAIFLRQNLGLRALTGTRWSLVQEPAEDFIAAIKAWADKKLNEQ